MSYTEQQIKHMACSALWEDQDMASIIEDSGDTLLAFAGYQEDGLLWIVISTPMLGEIARYTMDELIERYKAYRDGE